MQFREYASTPAPPTSITNVDDRALWSVRIVSRLRHLMRKFTLPLVMLLLRTQKCCVFWVFFALDVTLCSTGEYSYWRQIHTSRSNVEEDKNK
jgi:hypothetical protein